MQKITLIPKGSSSPVLLSILEFYKSLHRINAVDDEIIINDVPYKLSSLEADPNSAQVLQTIVDVTPAEMQQIYIRPKLFVPDPGQNKYINLLGCIGKIKYGIIPYQAGNDQLRVVYSPSFTSICTFSNAFIESTQNRVEAGGMALGMIVPENQGLYLRTDTMNPQNGNSSFQFKAIYTIEAFTI